MLEDEGFYLKKEGMKTISCHPVNVLSAPKKKRFEDSSLFDT